MLTGSEIINFLKEQNQAEINRLLRKADRVRELSVGNEIHIRSLIEISNCCGRDCLYCGLRRSNRKLKRYRMTDEEIIGVVRKEAASGSKSVVLQSGEDAAIKADRVAGLVRKIKRKADVAVTLSLGEYSREDYLLMKDAGADRYLLKHETIDPELYGRLHPDMKYENRLLCLEWLKETGFQTGAGIMVGLPGQSLESIADDILFMDKIRADMAGIGTFIPHPNTPLGGIAAGSTALTLKIIAITRLAIPELLIPATTALGTLHPFGRELALQSGANVIMNNVTPGGYRKLYEVYPGRIPPDGASDPAIFHIRKMAASLGRKVSTDYGHSYRLAKHI